LSINIISRWCTGVYLTGQEDDGLRKQILLMGIVCICAALLLVTPCLAAQPAKKCDVKIDKIKGECHAAEDLVISGRTKNIPDGTTIDLNFENPQNPVVPISTYVINNRYTATIDTAYLGVGTWNVWASTTFPVNSFAFSKEISFTILP